MSRRPARFTMSEVLTLIRAAQKEHARLVIELDREGRFRVIVNERSGETLDEPMDFAL